MSSTIYAKQNPSPVVTRRAPISNEDTGNGSQRITNRRSLSGKLRSLFRRDSLSPNRTTSKDRRPPPTTTSSVRQGSSSPASVKSGTEAPQLRAPTVHWPFGKKKTKLPPTTTNTSTTNKKKTKVSRKTKKTAIPPMEISSPIYQQENQTLIYGQNFTPRTPEFVHVGPGRLQSASNYEVTTTKGFRDYVVIDQTQQFQQVVLSDSDVFTPPTYTSDRSRSPSMNRQRLPNTNTEYHFYHDNAIPTVSIPIADIEVIPTPPRTRNVGETPPSTNRKIVVEKPPIFPQTSSRPPSSSTTAPSPSIITNPTQWKNTSSSTLNNSGIRSTTPTSKDVTTPKLNAPLIPFGSTSSKKKSQRTKSQSRTDGMASSSSTINNWTQQNPVNPTPSWTKTYGSLPDAEIIYGGSLTSLQPSKSNIRRYPGLSAIVQHHLRPAPVYYNQRPPTTPTVSLKPPQRFETSTTTLNEYETNQTWPPPINNGSTTSTSPHRHDGYIRPMTPQKPYVQPDVSLVRVDIDNIRGRSPPPRPSRYDSPDIPTTYRSSATIYTRDKHRYVDGGEIRTWSSHENNINNDSFEKPPYAHVQIDIKREPKTNGYDHRIVTPKIKEYYDEYRYSPRAHEQELYEKEQKIINDQEIVEEERYEISYEYEQQHQQYSYDNTHTHYDELNHSTTRYLNDTEGNQNLTYSNLTPTTRSVIRNERDKIYDQSSRSYASSERIQEPLIPVAPINKSEEIPRSYTLKRTDSYDGLGIAISASSQSRSNHYIREVEQGSPGHRAGLRKNDRIITVNGVNVENVDFSDVLILIKQGLDTDNLQLSVIHEPEYN